ncbi:MAG: glycosyltransferase [Candidatus Calescibacterium sp.]|nr:glycosyltransferase [Candidatus Calescibacterium sp.]MCX7733582.1 glycosyltransferase [bacterium]
MKLSIVIPFKDEKDLLPALINHILQSVPIQKEIIAVYDEKSSDVARYIEKAVKNFSDINDEIKFLKNKYGSGVPNAIRTALEHCTGDPIVFMTADFSDDPKTINQMIEKIKEGSDIVCGSRFSKGGGYLNGNLLKKLASQMTGVSLHYITGIPTKDITNTFKMFRKKVLEDVGVKGDGFEWAMRATCKSFYKGYRISEVPHVWREMRKEKKTNFKTKWIINYLKIYVWTIMNRFRTFRESYIAHIFEV